MALKDSEGKYYKLIRFDSAVAELTFEVYPNEDFRLVNDKDFVPPSETTVLSLDINQALEYVNNYERDDSLSYVENFKAMCYSMAKHLSETFANMEDC